MPNLDPNGETADRDLLSDLEVTKNAIIAAQTYDRHLTAEEIDALLGLP